MSLDIEFVRQQYPVFENPETARWAFFENAGGSYAPRQVTDRLTYLFHYARVQPYGLFESSVEAGEATDAGYTCAAGLLNADPDDVTIGPSTTLNFYVMAQALRSKLKPGDEIVVTNQDHEANIGCWERLGEIGAVIKRWTIDPVSGELNPEDLQALLSDRTRAVCFSLCSNIVGSMNDVSAITEMAHAAGALAIGDGVSFAPHCVFDVTRSGLDLYCFSTYKTFGPHLGVMWGKKEVLDQLQPQGHYFNTSQPHYHYNPTGPQYAQVGALAGLAEYIDTLYTHHFDTPEPDFHTRAKRLFDLFGAHETRLANQVLDCLRELPGARIIGQDRATGGCRAATIAVVPESGTSAGVVQKLVSRDLALRNGNFYARRCVEALGMNDADDGVVRISLVHYNSQEDVDRLVEGLREAF